MSEFLKIMEHEVQIAGLSFMGIVYIVRLIWLFKFRFKKEQTFPAGNTARAVRNSLLTVARPWGITSYKNNPVFYSQFVIFHLGVIAAISATFIIPHWPGVMSNRHVVWMYQSLLGVALFVGLLRLYRRISDPVLRRISTPDDYFSIIIMILFFAVGIGAVPNNYDVNEWPLLFFFLITSLFHIYVPFSKICHYLFYPFTHYYLGKTMGHRNIGGNG